MKMSTLRYDQNLGFSGSSRPRRGHRVAILSRAAAPLKSKMPKKEYRRLLCALSLVYGIESYVVLKDIWGSSNREVEQTARWMADALIDAALKGSRS